jgi:hypothetical protein
MAAERAKARVFLACMMAVLTAGLAMAGTMSPAQSAAPSRVADFEIHRDTVTAVYMESRAEASVEETYEVLLPEVLSQLSQGLLVLDLPATILPDGQVTLSLQELPESLWNPTTYVLEDRGLIPVTVEPIRLFVGSVAGHPERSAMAAIQGRYAEIHFRGADVDVQIVTEMASEAAEDPAVRAVVRAVPAAVFGGAASASGESPFQDGVPPALPGLGLLGHVIHQANNALYDEQEAPVYQFKMVLGEWRQATAAAHGDYTLYQMYGDRAYGRMAASILRSSQWGFRVQMMGEFLANTLVINAQPWPPAEDCAERVVQTQYIWTTNPELAQVNRDWVTFFAGFPWWEPGSGSYAVGCAYVGGVSDPHAYGYSAVMYFDHDTLLTANVATHEIGHLFGAEHGFAGKLRCEQPMWNLCSGDYGLSVMWWTVTTHYYPLLEFFAHNPADPTESTSNFDIVYNCFGYVSQGANQACLT